MSRAAAIVADADCLADLKKPVSDRTGGFRPLACCHKTKATPSTGRSVVTGFPRS
jgi:hypothetical protein